MFRAEPAPFRPPLRLLGVDLGTQAATCAISSPIQPSRGQHGHARSHSHRSPNEAPGTSCSSGSTKAPPFNQRQPIQVTQVQAQCGFGLTRRCSGLATLAAELHIVRPNWERYRRFTARVLPRRQACPPLHEAASSVARRSHDHGGARPPRAAPLPPRPASAPTDSSTFPSGERLLHGRVAAIAGGPATSCSVRCPLHSALLSGSSGSILAPKRLPGPSHAQFGQVGASMVTHRPTDIGVPDEAPGTSCSSGSTKAPQFHQRQPIQVTQVQVQCGFGLTRRCSGLASLAAELHFVRWRR